MDEQKRKSMTARFPRCHRHGRCCHRNYFCVKGLIWMGLYVISSSVFWEVFLGRVFGVLKVHVIIFYCAIVGR